MPRPRFERLSQAKRERIMEAAAREFAAHGFQDASLNKILQEAAISKGAAYYYFDDKADLFATTVSYYSENMLDLLAPAPDEMTETSFWKTIMGSYDQQLENFENRPWAFGAIKAAARLSVAEMASQPALQEIVTQIEERLQDLLQQGQELGVIRVDLPSDLLLDLFIAVDDTVDGWLLDNWHAVPRARRRATVRGVLAGLARFMAPPREARP